jgi:hypothetical protein
MAVRPILQLEREVTIELLPVTDAPATSDWLDISNFPSGSVHVYGEAGNEPTTLTGAVQESNIDLTGAEIVGLAFDETDMPALYVTKPVRLVRVDITAVAGGRVGATFHGARQN